MFLWFAEWKSIEAGQFGVDFVQVAWAALALPLAVDGATRIVQRHGNTHRFEIGCRRGICHLGDTGREARPLAAAQYAFVPATVDRRAAPRHRDLVEADGRSAL